jgi:hypothetical protein
MGRPDQIGAFHFNGSGIPAAATEDIAQGCQRLIEHHADVFPNRKRTDAADFKPQFGFDLLRRNGTKVPALDIQCIGQFLMVKSSK